MTLHPSESPYLLTNQLMAWDHIVVAIIGLAILFSILKSMVHVALMNRHDMDLFACLTSRAVHKVIGLRVRSVKKYEDAQQTLYLFFGTYILSLISVYFIGAMIAFAFLYWGAWAVTGWNQAFIAAGSGLTTLGFATPTTHMGQWLAIPEGALGLGIVVFLFTFVPGFQSAVSSRDDQTAWLYARLTNPTNQADLSHGSTALMKVTKQRYGKCGKVGSVSWQTVMCNHPCCPWFLRFKGVNRGLSRRQSYWMPRPSPSQQLRAPIRNPQAYVYTQGRAQSL